MESDSCDTELAMLSHTDRGPPSQDGGHHLPDQRFLEEDRLLTALLNDSENGRIIGRSRGSFGSTINRKAKKKKTLYTQLLTLYPALLDDSSPGLVELMLRRSHHWEFNAFHLDRFSGGHSLSTLCVHLFHSLGLISSFGMDPAEVFAFFRLVERGYHSGNPYHTSLHAADVTQAIAVFCMQPCIANHLSQLELLAVVTAAVCHDLDHPGVNEKFLVSAGSHLAVLYDNVSVLENHHWRSAIACFVESGLTKYVTESQFAEFTDLVRSLVLATDISRQQEFLTQFRYFLDTSEFDTSQLNHRHFVLQIAIKCADISNPCRTWPVSRLWSLRACEEFFRQGDSERDLGLLLTPICDRFNVTVAKVQVGFYTFVAEPLFKEWHRFLNCPLSEAMLQNLYSNQAVWEGEVLQEEINSVEAPTKPEVEERPPIHVFAPQPPVQPKLSSLQRRLSLPATDPLHRIFDQMTQPDNELPRAAHLRRNFSLTDRRRSSLLRGLHNRSSLKPIRGRVSRPASVCLENTENIRLNRTLQSRENRLSDQYCMDVSADEPSKCNTNSSKSEIVDSEVEKENTGLHSALQTRLTKRRGSAPSNLVLGDCRIPSNTQANIIKQQNCLSVVTTRRGSLPSELLNNSLPKQLRNRVIANSNNGNKRPGLLRRRSMGPELLSLGTNQFTKERQLVQKYLNRPF